MNKIVGLQITEGQPGPVRYVVLRSLHPVVLGTTGDVWLYGLDYSGEAYEYQGDGTWKPLGTEVKRG